MSHTPRASADTHPLPNGTAAPRTAAPRTAARYRRALTTLAAAALLSLGGLATASPAYAHDELVGFALTPESADSAPETPTGFVLQFNNELTELGAEVNAVDSAGRTIVDGTPELSGRELSQSFTPDLADGNYTITWKVVSSDGHPIAGALTMEISSGSPASLATTDLAEAASTVEPSAADTVTDGSEPSSESAAGTPAWVTPVAIIGGIGVIGAVGAVMIRKFRSATPPADRAGQAGGNE